MSSETIINVTDRDATVGGRAGGNALDGSGGQQQRSVQISVLSRMGATAETVRLFVYGERQTVELCDALESAATALRATLPESVESDALSRLAESGDR